MIRVSLTMGLVMAASLSWGVYTGQGPGRSTIGVGGDYPSLYAATRAVNQQPLSGGDWTFEIVSNLTETNNSFLGQSDTGGHTITFKPAAGTSSTVTFTTTSLNTSLPAGPHDYVPGHFVIGASYGSNPAGTGLAVPTDRVVIDGTSGDDGSGRSLAFRNVSGQGASSMIVVYGDSDHITLKNLDIALDGSTSAAQYSQQPSAIAFKAALRGPGTPGVAAPVADHVVVKNCRLATTSSSAPTIPLFHGVRYEGDAWGSWEYPFAAGAVGVVFEQNEIITNYIGINTGTVAEGRVSGNSIRYENAFRGYQAGMIHIAIDLVGQVAGVRKLVADANEIEFDDRDISLLGELVTGISLWDTFSTVQTSITNNIIQMPKAERYGQLADWSGINYFCTGSGAALIAHNSVEMPASGLDLASSQRPCGISVGLFDNHWTPMWGGMLVLRSNVVRMGQDNGICVYLPDGIERVVSDHNNFYRGAGAVTGYVGMTEYADLSAWQAGTGLDSGSTALDPRVPNTEGAGVWEDDLRFTRWPGDVYIAPDVAGVNTDVDGKPRPAGRAIKGADQPEENAAGVSEWEQH